MRSMKILGGVGSEAPRTSSHQRDFARFKILSRDKNPFFQDQSNDDEFQCLFNISVLALVCPQTPGLSWGSKVENVYIQSHWRSNDGCGFWVESQFWHNAEQLPAHPSSMYVALSPPGSPPRIWMHIRHAHRCSGIPVQCCLKCNVYINAARRLRSGVKSSG